MKTETFTLFTDTGGILLLDPLNVSELEEDFAEHFNIALDPEGEGELAVEHDGDWPGVWSEAVARLRRMSIAGEFALVLSGEGTFHVRVQTGELDAEERARLLESFEERVRIRSGRLAFTDGREFFEDELPGEGAILVEVPEGYYTARIYHLRRTASQTPTVGVYGSDQHPSLVVRLVEAEPSGAETHEGEPFPRLSTSRQGYEEPKPGWNCYAQVTRIGEGEADLELMLTETVYSGHARMSVPTGEELKVGDYVLVRLIENAGNYWKAEWRD
jgi:hypothetical protein